MKQGAVKIFILLISFHYMMEHSTNNLLHWVYEYTDTVVKVFLPYADVIFIYRLLLHILYPSSLENKAA